MGNSTRTLSNVVDYVMTIGELAPVIPAGGYSQVQILGMANNVMRDLCAERFNWKWNRMTLPQFPTTSLQQDYASVTQKSIGWLENCVAIDINNTALPKPIRWLEVVRDLQITSTAFGRPERVCWLPNDQMVQGAWPGAAIKYTNPVGAASTPSNPPTNILDANGNILVLTTYGFTGGVAPVAAVGAAAGTTVADFGCVWTVADPKAQGIRVTPLPPQTGVVWSLYITAQMRATQFTAVSQTLDPLPDDYSHHFENGFIAYCYQHSASPVTRMRFEQMHALWMASLAGARGQGDREREDARIVPERSIMDDTPSVPIGPAWPYGPGF